MIKAAEKPFDLISFDLYMPVVDGLTTAKRMAHDPDRRYGSSKYGTFARGIPGLFDLLAVRWMRKRRLTYEIESITRHG